MPRKRLQRLFVVRLVHDDKAALAFTRFAFSVICAAQKKIEPVANLLKSVLDRVLRRDMGLIDRDAEQSDGRPLSALITW
jgi:hypothetical protein